MVHSPKLSDGKNNRQFKSDSHERFECANPGTREALPFIDTARGRMAARQKTEVSRLELFEHSADLRDHLLRSAAQPNPQYAGRGELRAGARRNES